MLAQRRTSVWMTSGIGNQMIPISAPRARCYGQRQNGYAIAASCTTGIRAGRVFAVVAWYADVVSGTNGVGIKI